MKCSDIMSRDLEMLSEDATIGEAARRMAEAGIGFLPICDGDRKVIGVVTDRDLVTRAMAKGLDAETASAALVMTSPALTCLAEADLRDAEQLMAAERKARLVLTNRDGTLAGVLSVADLVERAPKRQAVETLKAILWREALGPRAGAARGAPLLKDLPIAPASNDDVGATETVFTGGRHDMGAKEFPS